MRVQETEFDAADLHKAVFLIEAESIICEVKAKDLYIYYKGLF
jgi:hypothetical protein